MSNAPLIAEVLPEDGLVTPRTQGDRSLTRQIGQVVSIVKELQRLREKAFPIFEGLTDKLIPVSNEGASADQARDVVCQVALQAWGELAQQSRNSNAAI